MTTILALDLAKSTGFCELTDGFLVESGTVLLEGDLTARFIGLREWLDQRLSVDVVVVERGHCRGWAPTISGIGFRTVAAIHARMRSSGFDEVHTGTLKKWATGNGKASKARMMERASELAGRDIKCDDEADAICLAFYSWENLNEV